ncbi:MAG: hypothetical protein H0X64_11675 [Gemmatimonadaceae bacterium]|nr:hypothetical protein [Gemmatimonadaceae bacterium]
MATTLGRATVARFSPAASVEAIDRDVRAPWYLTAVLIAAALTYVGVLWDIAWHSTIGRDTFWSPPHLCTYASGLLVGIACGWIALKTTFAGTPEERARSVGLWGFRAPLGAWICTWGAIALLTSAPFDDWWHGAYGLDVMIISPPHTLLSLGMIAIVGGALLMGVAWQNRAPESERRSLERYVLVAMGIFLGMVALYTYEYSIRIFHHSARFYQVSAIGYPLVLVAAARVSTRRWPATTVTAVYMLSRLVMGWMLPLFDAAPKLGPVYNPVTHMIPMQFPLLLIIPGIGIDLLMRRLGRTATPARDWANALLFGVVFVALFVAAQWPFASFLQSPAARNPVFWSDLFPYAVPADTFSRRFEFIPGSGAMALATGLLIAMVWATLSSRAGLAWGRWMRQVQR